MSTVEQEEYQIHSFLDSDKKELDHLLEMVSKQVELQKTQEQHIEEIARKSEQMATAVSDIRDMIPQNLFDKVVQHAFDSSAGLGKLDDEKLERMAEEWELVTEKGEQVDSLMGELVSINEEIRKMLDEQRSLIDDQQELEEITGELAEIAKRGTDEKLMALIQEESRLVNELEEIDREEHEAESIEGKSEEEWNDFALQNINSFIHDLGFMTGRGNFILPEYREEVMDLEDRIKTKGRRLRDEFNQGFSYNKTTNKLDFFVKKYKEELGRLKQLV